VTQEHMRRSCPLDIPEEDLNRCHSVLGINAWRDLADRNIFITGGTGFVGKWLLATLLDAKETLGLNCNITVLSRNPAAFLSTWPRMARQVEWISGDVREFAFGNKHFDVIVHAATDVIAHTSPQEVFDTCLEGTRRVMALARQSGATKVLMVSSGAIYGPLPPGMTHVPENHMGGPDPLDAKSAYAEGKRVSEWIAAQEAKGGLDVKIARIFAVVGPHLPLDKHYAVGNFIKAGLAGKEIVIEGDGTPHRSYLYAADMAAWLWAILFRGQSIRPYNVGSDESISILDLAVHVSELLTASTVRIRSLCAPDSKQLPQYYVPSIHRIQTELGLSNPMPLLQALEHTSRWHLKHLDF
jgi:nucleoside-diphosphate-sugar epimerase